MRAAFAINSLTFLVSLCIIGSPKYLRCCRLSKAAVSGRPSRCRPPLPRAGRAPRTGHLHGQVPIGASAYRSTCPPMPPFSRQRVGYQISPFGARAGEGRRADTNCATLNVTEGFDAGRRGMPSCAIIDVTEAEGTLIDGTAVKARVSGKDQGPVQKGRPEGQNDHSERVLSRLRPPPEACHTVAEQ